MVCAATRHSPVELARHKHTWYSYDERKQWQVFGLVDRHKQPADHRLVPVQSQSDKLQPLLSHLRACRLTNIHKVQPQWVGCEAQNLLTLPLSPQIWPLARPCLTHYPAASICYQATGVATALVAAVQFSTTYTAEVLQNHLLVSSHPIKSPRRTPLPRWQAQQMPPAAQLLRLLAPPCHPPQPCPAVPAVPAPEAAAGALPDPP